MEVYRCDRCKAEQTMDTTTIRFYRGSWIGHEQIDYCNKCYRYKSVSTKCSNNRNTNNTSNRNNSNNSNNSNDNNSNTNNSNNKN